MSVEAKNYSNFNHLGENHPLCTTAQKILGRMIYIQSILIIRHIKCFPDIHF